MDESTIIALEVTLEFAVVAESPSQNALANTCCQIGSIRDLTASIIVASGFQDGAMSV